ncbi:cytochrome c3 family protein [Anaeromyxobacter oryzisoli]|uniref:cytochrome c3 family protein n=1 Tax=Anaeromyxobacter oryzisoli TaxID=2925408 RepID=UPI0038CBFDF1
MRVRFAPLLTAAALALAAQVARGADDRLAPLPREQAASSHGPFEMGACDTCHARNDSKNPGPASAGNDVCFGCHDEFSGSAPVKMDRAVHPRTNGTKCLACHSPHNSRNRKLLLRS